MVNSRDWKTKSEVIAELGNEEIFIVNDIDYNDTQLVPDVLKAREDNPERSVWRISELDLYLDNVEPDPEEFKKLCLIKRHFNGRIRKVENPIF